jgi:hypothetical protein
MHDSRDDSRCLSIGWAQTSITPDPGFDRTSKGFRAMFRQKGGG